MPFQLVPVLRPRDPEVSTNRRRFLGCLILFESSSQVTASCRKYDSFAM